VTVNPASSLPGKSGKKEAGGSACFNKYENNKGGPMKAIRILLPALAVLFLSGCYMHFKAPAPELAVPLKGESAEKAGTAECTQVLWAFAFGDCSVKTAMANGDIDRVHHVDSEVQLILYGLYSNVTIRTWGE
jgi:hypothetical protein